MDEIVTFNEICGAVRFRLDDVSGSDDLSEHAAASFIAQIRMQALRVCRTTTPTLHKSLLRITEALGILESPEVYVTNDPRANAFALPFGPRSRPFLVLNSGLVDLLTIKEIEFAAGHELGHCGMAHGIHPALDETGSELGSLLARSQQRYAEISADRIGLLAIRSVYSAAHVMVKLASGLRGDSLTLDIDAFLEQLKRDPAELSREWELQQSHPALPLRLWALLKFAETKEYAQLSGSGQTGRGLQEVDEEIIARLAELGDGRLDEIEADCFQLALTWLGVYLIADDNRIEPHERVALTDLVGEDSAAKAIRFAQDHGMPAVRDKLRQAMERIRSANATSRNRLVESFTTFANSLNMKPESTKAWELVNDIVEIRRR